MKKMLVGFALADAMGVPVEFKSRLSLKSNPVVGMRGYGTWNQPAGTWSDDTTMTLATMQSITHLKTIDVNDMMCNFAKWYKHGEFTVSGRFDIGHTTRDGIKRFFEGMSPILCGSTDINSNGNGSLMRMTPIAMYFYAKYRNNFPADAMKTIHKVSALTHAHPISKIGCGLYCLIMAELLSSVPVQEAINTGLRKGLDYYKDIPEYAQHLRVYSRLFDNNFSALPEKAINSSAYIVDTLESAIWCLLNTSDYKSLILTAVNLGLDTDTVAAVTAGLGGVIYDYNDLPSTWLKTLRKKDYLERMEQAFFKTLESL